MPAHLSRIRGCFLLLGLLAVVAGCSDGREGPTGPTPIAGGGLAGRVLLTANPASLAPGESSALTATAQSAGGAPLADRTVQLSTTRGTLGQTTGTTNAAGTFPTTLQTSPTDTGTATVTATVEGVSATATVTLVAQALAIAPTTATMSAGATQDFTAAGGVPPYTWSAGGGTVSPATGATTTYTAGSSVGTFAVTVRDAAGTTASATATIQ